MRVYGTAIRTRLAGALAVGGDEWVEIKKKLKTDGLSPERENPPKNLK